MFCKCFILHVTTVLPKVCFCGTGVTLEKLAKQNIEIVRALDAAHYLRRLD